MSFVINTVTGHYNLLDEIRLLVETNLSIAERYAVLREDYTTNDHEIIWKAPGLSGTENIYFGIKTYQSSSSDYYNFKFGCFTGYVPGNSFETQPGGYIMATPLWNQSIPFWLVADGQSLTCFSKIENQYEGLYLGKYLPYSEPGQYPLPLFCGGSFSDAPTLRYSDTNHHAFFKGSLTNSRLRHVDGLWKQIDVLPYKRTRQLRNTINNSNTPEGYYGGHSLVLSDSTPNVYGELNHLLYISGFNNSAENIGTYQGIPYVCFPNIARNGFNEYVALRLS